MGNLAPSRQERFAAFGLYVVALAQNVLSSVVLLVVRACVAEETA